VTPERWQEVKNVLAGAMEIDRPQRCAWLDQACHGDQQLRDEVESLLHAASQPGEIGSAFDGSTAEQAILATALGRQYEIVRSLGHGGMGNVYLARERALDRFVAIKVLRPDLADAPEIRERFRREAVVASGHPAPAHLW
jgi:serine/threonine-protein kinase